MNPSNPFHLLGTPDDVTMLNGVRRQVHAWPAQAVVEPPQLHVVKTANVARELEALIEHKQRQQTWANACVFVWGHHLTVQLQTLYKVELKWRQRLRQELAGC